MSDKYLRTNYAAAGDKIGSYCKWEVYEKLQSIPEISKLQQTFGNLNIRRLKGLGIKSKCSLVVKLTRKKKEIPSSEE